jgi:hypothetical protein
MISTITPYLLLISIISIPSLITSGVLGAITNLGVIPHGLHLCRNGAGIVNLGVILLEITLITVVTLILSGMVGVVIGMEEVSSLGVIIGRGDLDLGQMVGAIVGVIFSLGVMAGMVIRGLILGVHGNGTMERCHGTLVLTA